MNNYKDLTDDDLKDRLLELKQRYEDKFKDAKPFIHQLNLVRQELNDLLIEMEQRGLINKE